MSADLRALLEKYEALLALRERRDVREREGFLRFEPAEAAARKKAFRRLAHRFPSALTELELPTEELALRLDRVRRCLAGAATPEEVAWARAMVDLHLALRLVLAARRHLRRTGADASAFDAFCRRFEVRARRRGLEGPGASEWAERLGLAPAELYDFVRRPPEGRFRTHVARALGWTETFSAGQREGGP
ncbi:MAG TPA: hypothetical protein VKY51_08365 [Fredinandcohnia sp.]|nr:hypothetical protein [Fredinandcohnia sp.]